MIEENSLNFATLSFWEGLMDVFLRILNNNELVILWLEGRKFNETFSLIFNSNFIKNSDLAQIFELNKNKQQLTENFSEAFVKLVKNMGEQYMEKTRENKILYDEVTKRTFMKLIKFLLNDHRTFFANNKNYTLRSLLLDSYFKYMRERIVSLDDYYYLHREDRQPTNEPFFKCCYIPLLELLSESFNLPIKDYSIEPWYFIILI